MISQHFSACFEKLAFDPESALIGGGAGAVAGGLGGDLLSKALVKKYLAQRYGLGKLNPEYVQRLQRGAGRRGGLAMAVPVGLAGALLGGAFGGEKTAEYYDPEMDQSGAVGQAQAFMSQARDAASAESSEAVQARHQRALQRWAVQAARDAATVPDVSSMSTSAATKPSSRKGIPMDAFSADTATRAGVGGLAGAALGGLLQRVRGRGMGRGAALGALGGGLLGAGAFNGSGSLSNMFSTSEKTAQLPILEWDDRDTTSGPGDNTVLQGRIRIQNQLIEDQHQAREARRRASYGSMAQAQNLVLNMDPSDRQWSGIRVTAEDIARDMRPRWDARLDTAGQRLAMRPDTVRGQRHAVKMTSPPTGVPKDSGGSDLRDIPQSAIGAGIGGLAGASIGALIQRARMGGMGRGVALGALGGGLLGAGAGAFDVPGSLSRMFTGQREKTAGLSGRLLRMGALTGGGLMGLQALGAGQNPSGPQGWQRYVIPNPEAITAGARRVGQFAQQNAMQAGQFAQNIGEGLQHVPPAFMEGYRE